MKSMMHTIHHLTASNWLLRFLTVGVVIVMSISAIYFNVGKHPFVDEAGLWASLGALTLLLVLLLIWNRPSYPTSVRQYPHSETRIRTRWGFVILGVGMLALFAEINGKVLRIRELLTVSSHYQFALWVVGIFAVAYGLAGWRYVWQEQTTPSGETYRIRVRVRDKMFSQHIASIPRSEAIGVGIILITATIARAWELETAVRLWVDEVHFSNPVLHFHANMTIDLLIPFSSVAAFPYVFPYMQWHFVELIGWNLIGLRFFSVILGVANVLAVYLLVRELFERRMAFLATVAFATLPIHIHFSRLALNNIADPLFGTLTFYFIARGLNRPHQMRANFVWAGAMLGLTQYFYEGGRFLYPALTLSWLGLVGGWAYLRHIRPLISLTIFRPAKRKAILEQLADVRWMPFLRAGILLWIVAACVGAPVYYTLVARNYSLAQRLETAGVSERTVQTMQTTADVIKHGVKRLYESMMIHVSIPDASVYYGGDTSFIIGLLIPFFLIGIFYAIWLMLFGGVFEAKHVAGATLLVLWIGLTWFGNTFLEESRISARYVVEFPALAMVIAFGALAIVDGLVINHEKWRNRMIGVLVCVIAIPQLMYYFGYHLPLFNVQFRDDRGRNYDVEDALYRSVGFPSGTRVHIVDFPTMYSPDAHNILRFLTRERGRDMNALTMRPADFTDDYLQRQSRLIDHAFYLPPIDILNIQRLKAHFADELQGPFYTEFPASIQKGFVLYYLPADPSQPAPSG